MWCKFNSILVCIVFLHFLQGTEGLRILGIFPQNSKSHHAVHGRIMQGLAEKGHQVDVYGHFPLKKPIPNFNDYSLDGSLTANVNNLTFHDATKVHLANLRQVMVTRGSGFCELMDLPIFQKLLKNPPRYDLVIVEAMIAQCYLAWGRYLKAPMIGIIPNQMIDWQYEYMGSPMNTAVMPSLGYKALDRTNFWDRLSNTLVSKLVTVMFKYYIHDQDKYVERYFGPGFPDVMELFKDHDLMFTSTHYSLQGAFAHTPTVVQIAGVHIVDDDTKLTKEVQKWLDDSKHGCIYVSFGSMVRFETFPKQVIESFYASFEKIAPVRVLMKIAKPEDLPQGLPANVMTQSWLPQEQVLKHNNTKIFVTHGGLMSCQESIYYAVPMIGIPLFGDQRLNVESNVQRGISLMISHSEITESKLTAAFNDLLSNPTYTKNIIQLSKRFTDRPLKPLDEAIYWVEYVARHGPRSLRSPIVDMPWWQVNLLDVYGFILLFVLAAYYLLKFTICKVYSSFKKFVMKESKSTKKND